MKKLNQDLMIILASALQTSTTEYTKICEAHGLSLDQATDFSDASESNSESPAYMRKFWKEYSKPLTGGESAPRHTKRKRLKPGNFFFTSAQNNTEVHEKFLQSIQRFCEAKNAQLIVGKFTYNKSVFRNGVKDNPDEIYFAPVLEPYFLNEDAKIEGHGLVWAGSLNILPTAKYPLSGLEQFTGPHSTIVPHAKIGMESIATQKNDPAKFMYSTGCITLRNYTDTKAGRIAEQQHNFGGLYVEVRDNNWFAYQIETDESGEFQFMREYVTPDSITDKPVKAIQWGDLHAEHAAIGGHSVLGACSNMLEQLAPEFQFFHDTLDMRSRNHHNRNDSHFLARMNHEGATVLKDLQDTAGTLMQYFDDGFSKWVFVESNHDLALESWLKDTRYDFRYDPQNALLYFELQAAVLRAISEGESLHLLEYAIQNQVYENESYPKPFQNAVWLQIDDSFKVAGIECAIHGHTGSNGSKGSPKQLTKLNTPMNTGHTHSASIYLGVYTSGVIGADDLDMGYNIGASSWSHSHVLTYDSGFRTIVTMKRENGTVPFYW